MADIPQELMDEAFALLNKLRPSFGGYTGAFAWSDTDTLARALMGRDQRAAEIARSTFTESTVRLNKRGRPYLSGSAAICAARRIATAILTYKEPVDAA